MEVRVLSSAFFIPQSAGAFGNMLIIISLFLALIPLSPLYERNV